MEHRLTWCSVWKQSQKAYRLMYRYIVYIYIHIYIYTYIYINIYIYHLKSAYSIARHSFQCMESTGNRLCSSTQRHSSTRSYPGAIPELSRSYPLETSLIWAMNSHRSWPLIGSASLVPVGPFLHAVLVTALQPEQPESAHEAMRKSAQKGQNQLESALESARFGTFLWNL